MVFERYNNNNASSKDIIPRFSSDPLGSGLKLIFPSTPYVLGLRQSTDTPQGKDFAGTHRNSTEGFLKKLLIAS
jgi:hypothetical protein